MMKSATKNKVELDLTKTACSKEISVDGKSLMCESCFCQDFAQASNGESVYGYPSLSFLYERVVDSTHAYLIDRDGRYWGFTDEFLRLLDNRSFIIYVSCCEEMDHDFDDLNKVRGNVPLFFKEGCDVVRKTVLKEKR
jgi:hypothetical protein